MKTSAKHFDLVVEP